MKGAPNIKSRGLNTGLKSLALAVSLVLSAGTIANADNYSEVYSSTGASPTKLDFGLGGNLVTGETGGFVSSYFDFTIGPDEVLSNLYVEAANVFARTDETFIGLESGPAVTVPSTPPFSSAGLLGYTLYDFYDEGTDILPAIGAANPPGFPNSGFGGATTFTPPLKAGTYSVWVVDGDGAANSVPFSLDFVVSSVPEPSTWALLMVGLGGVGFLLRRSRNPRARKCAGAISA